MIQTKNLTPSQIAYLNHDRKLLLDVMGFDIFTRQNVRPTLSVSEKDEKSDRKAVEERRARGILKIKREDAKKTTNINYTTPAVHFADALTDLHNARRELSEHARENPPPPPPPPRSLRSLQSRATTVRREPDIDIRIRGEDEEGKVAEEGVEKIPEDEPEDEPEDATVNETEGAAGSASAMTEMDAVIKEKKLATLRGINDYLRRINAHSINAKRSDEEVSMIDEYMQKSVALNVGRSDKDVVNYFGRLLMPGKDGRMQLRNASKIAEQYLVLEKEYQKMIQAERQTPKKKAGSAPKTPASSKKGGAQKGKTTPSSSKKPVHSR